MSQERWLGLFLVLLIIGAGGYIGIIKFKQAVELSPSPTPSPLALEFNQPRADAGQSQEKEELPLKKIKRLDRFPGILSPDVLANKKAVIETDKGRVEVEIYPEASMAASAFVVLSANGFYDGLTFHRVEPDFVVQGGDPNGDGTGGPGFTFPDEPVTKPYTKGVVAMANAGPNTNGSQFFIMLEDYPELAPKYTIFGKVISGQGVVEGINVGDVMQRVTIQNLR